MTSTINTRNRLFTFASCLGIVLVQLDVSIVNVGLHSLKEAYNASVSDLEWVINAYALVFAALMLSSGTIVDKLGSKKTFISGVIVFIFASVFCAMAPSIFWLDIMRAAQGIGAALLLPSSLTLLRQYFSAPEERTSAIAMWASSGALALIAGPVLGGALIKYLGWKSIFLINFPLGLISIGIICWLANAGEISPKKINFSNQFLITSGLALLTFTLTEAGQYGWTSPVIITTLIVGLLMLIAYRKRDSKANNPVISHEILANPLIISAVVVGFLCNLVFYGAMFIFSIYFQSKLHLSALETGLAFMPMMALTALVNFSSKWFVHWFSVRSLSLLGSIISLIGFCMVMFISPDWSATQLYIPMILLGSGTSFAMPVMTNLVLGQATNKSAGSASALFNCARQMGGVTGVAIFGLLLSSAGVNNMSDGLKMVSLAASGISLFWLIMGLKKLPEQKLHSICQ